MVLAKYRLLSTFKAPRLIAGFLSMLMLVSVPSCIQRIWERDDTALVRIVKAPPIAVEAGEDRHLVVMQAPSPGWSIRLDATELTPVGKRVFVTIRKPDPAYQYTQQIVLMRVLTSVRLDSEIEVVGRLLEFNEKTKGRGYAPVPVVESFE